jgi:hypothetical protein
MLIPLELGKLLILFFEHLFQLNFTFSVILLHLLHHGINSLILTLLHFFDLPFHILLCF